MNVFSTEREATDFVNKTERFALLHYKFNDKTMRPEGQMKVHTHDYYEITYILSGAKEIYVDGKYHEVDKNVAFLIAPDETHYISKIDKSSHERAVLAIHPKFFSRHSTDTVRLDRCFDNPKNRTINIDYSNHYRITSLLQRIITADGYGSDLVEDHKLCELLILLTNIQIDQKKIVAQNVSIRENTIEKNITNYINDNFTDDINLDELSAMFLLSKSYICRIFKNFNGTTINSYINHRRVNMAKQLINEGISLGDACAEVGYNSYNIFYKSFVSITGMSPRDYSKGKLP